MRHLHPGKAVKASWNKLTNGASAEQMGVGGKKLGWGLTDTVVECLKLLNILLDLVETDLVGLWCSSGKRHPRLSSRGMSPVTMPRTSELTMFWARTWSHVTSR